ncbi:MAG TPA: hypothetical protein VFG59_11820 [Anaeromyxobacter sp.]|nr:hypothetical protein [Anaeromyxobacter sp.]
MPDNTSGASRDVQDLVGPSRRMTKGSKKKPPRKTGAMGAPKKATKRTTKAKKRGK